MKFHQVRPGARFEYRGTVYRKISPLKAANEADDSQRLIPRSGEITLLDEHGQAVSEELPEMLPAGRVEAALERLLSACERATLRIDPPLTDSQRVQLQRTINSAGQDMLLRLAQDE